ncbi:outer membrane beta-barrel protein [Sunxiuqinia sp. sy24]|uniref:outer membrane beta-barrel protein n=1 Tax=Sunxiuqinia sp. sy24 TaxID=3461495 RepID=UPI004046720E
MKTKGLTLFGLIILLSVSSLAQEKNKRFGFELSSGVSIASQKLADVNLNTGLGIEGIFHYRFLQHVGIYAGWGWNSFGADNSFTGNDVCFEETGYVYGLQFKHPIGNSPISYYLRTGGLYNHIETENADGDIIDDTGHGLGWQAAVGFDIELGNNWSLTPGVKFNSLSRDTQFEGVSRQLDLKYQTLRIGILRKF